MMTSMAIRFRLAVAGDVRRLHRKPAAGGQSRPGRAHRLQVLHVAGGVSDRHELRALPASFTGLQTALAAAAQSRAQAVAAEEGGAAAAAATATTAATTETGTAAGGKTRATAATATATGKWAISVRLIKTKKLPINESKTIN